MFEYIPIYSRHEWLATRLLDVTASEIAALKGIHPFVTPFGLYAKKIAATVDDESSPQMERGLLLQPVALEKIKLDHPDWKIYDPETYYRDSAARIGATPDALVEIPGRDGFGVVQIKSVVPALFKRNWVNSDGEIDPPLWIVLQASVEAYCTGASYAMVAPMVIGHKIDVHLIEIPLRTDLIDSLKADVAEFWQRVENRRPPEITSVVDFEVVAKLYKPVAGATIDLRGDNELTGLADRDEELKATIKAAEAERKTIKARFVAALDSCEIGILADGRAIMAKTIHKKAYEVPASSYLSVTVKEIRS